MLPLENRAARSPTRSCGTASRWPSTAFRSRRLHSVLDGEIAAHRADDQVAARFFARMGGYAPTVGIIGTVVGLVQVLRASRTRSVLGPLVAGAFVATLWGVLSANFLWLPMSVKIRRNSELRTAQMQLLLTGSRDPGRHQPAGHPGPAALHAAAQRGSDALPPP